MKGSGDIHAVIEKDPKSHALFSLTLSKNADKNFTRIKNRLDKAKKFNRKAKFGSKYEKFMVIKDAGFENIHAGDYYLYLYGIMGSPCKTMQVRKISYSRGIGTVMRYLQFSGEFVSSICIAGVLCIYFFINLSLL